MIIDQCVTIKVWQVDMLDSRLGHTLVLLKYQLEAGSKILFFLGQLGKTTVVGLAFKNTSKI